MRICILAAGAAGMYCGSCLRDNALAGALMRAGHDVSLIPLYTPLKTDSPDVSINQVFVGGVNAYLQYASGLFRHTPRLLDWFFDRPWLLNLAGKYGAQTSPAKLGPFTLSILRGDEGPQIKELHRLLEFLKSDVKPELVSLPNAMFIGVAGMLQRELGVPIICELTGEDIFLDAMAEPYRTQARDIIRQRAAHVSRFVATSHFYAQKMSDYLAIPQDKIAVVYPGITREHLKQENAHGVHSPDSSNSRPPAIGYFARICPEKGLDRLIDALAILRKMPDMSQARVHAAGYLGAAHKQWFADLQNKIYRNGLTDAFKYVGEVDLAGKLAFLDSVDLLSVPTAYAEPKGIYILEALARGTPVVQPHHGAFPELINLTAGGLLAAPGDASALAKQLALVLSDSALRHKLGSAGRQAIETSFIDDHMAAKMLTIYQDARMNDSAETASLQVKNLHKQYPTPAQPLVVLTGVSLSLNAGQTMAIVGPSGSGKSTLLNILGTLDQPTSGDVRLAGINPFSLSANDLARFRSEQIGFIFQDHHLLPQCTAVENVLIARLAIGPTRTEDVQRAQELLKRVGLADRQSHLPSELSGGERQRVAIARALMNRPALLLCDEPTGNLDSKISRSIGDLLKQVAAEEKTMLIVVTHSTMLAEMFGRTMRMEDGRLVDGA